MKESEKIPYPRESASLRFFYHTALGRLLLKPLVSRGVSKLCGAFLETRASKCLIPRFIRKSGIDLADYETDRFSCFNDCFSRKIRPELRPIDPDPDALIAPCDGLLSAYRIGEGTVLPVKHSAYTVSDLLGGNGELAREFDGGVCLVFRLCVTHYHRYCYPDDGSKGENRFIAGKLHTVRPIALGTYPVFIRNCREYTVLETAHFGKIVQMEVGALLVGKIANLDGAGKISKGAEKGKFLYGGSTIILLLQNGAAEIPEWVFEATKEEKEVPVKMGERIN